MQKGQAYNHIEGYSYDHNNQCIGRFVCMEGHYASLSRALGLSINIHPTTYGKKLEICDFVSYIGD